MRAETAAWTLAVEVGAGLGLPTATVLLAAMEAGVPIPVPSDLVILLLGERTSAGRLPLPLAALALELVAAIGTTARCSSWSGDPVAPWSNALVLVSASPRPAWPAPPSTARPVPPSAYSLR